MINVPVSVCGLSFDEILSICGDRGRYQILLLGLFGLLNFLAAIHYFVDTIATFVPDHWCYHEKLRNMSFEDIEQVYKRFERPSCTKLKNVYDIDNVTKSNEPCTRWIYKYDFGFRSMNTDLNWVCDAAYKSSVGKSFFFIGSVLGTLILGFLADIFGRLPVLIVSNVLAFFGDFITIFGDKMWSFSVCRFISGLSIDTDVYLMQVIVIEYINPKWRTLGLNLMIGIFYCAGAASSPWIAVAAGNWKTFLYCASFPMLFVLSYYFIVRESALWLLTRNNFEGALKRLKYVAKINRRHVTEQDFENFRRNCEELKNLKDATKKKETFFDLFRESRLRRIIFILFYESIVMTLSYDAVSRNMENLGISAMIAFSVSALVILPGSMVVICFQDLIGRKGMASISMLIAGIVTTVQGVFLWFAMENDPMLLLGFVFAARFCAGVAYDSGQQFTAEIMPSSVRGQSVAVIHVVGYAATFLVPYIILLGKHFRSAPSIILAVLNIIGSFTWLLLPETTRKTLPKSIDDLETFGVDEGIFTFVCCSRNASRK